MTEEITNSEDIIDSRNIIDRIEELREDVADLDDSELFELDTLIALDKLGRNNFPDSWKDGVGLVRDSYFKTHAQEYAEDIGAVDSKMGWPGSHLDWDEAAEELQTNYSCLEFDGVDYWAK